MPAEIVWSRLSRFDLVEIADFIAIESPRAAQKYVEALEESSLKLADFPLSGRKYNEKFRCLVFKNHIIFYEYEKSPDRVLIAMVIDGRSDYGRTFEALLKD